ncbi:hypothetical protein AT15_01330 [Kosmotoga arenicorallina S304]|uniref:Peptidase S8/S53 domain-containing protein n=1 Tax=Kosmotoga arenicorallina S304 TaxID=1453497 RepID=A0A176JZZ0_9BACT|nr:S8 family serine peptidase [Kosmotoga arenicorallina]OAA29711.1 hypothetical protein AT15_01330 [Kosmotoga arenicorallina S304]
MAVYLAGCFPRSNSRVKVYGKIELYKGDAAISRFFSVQEFSEIVSGNEYIIKINKDVSMNEIVEKLPLGAKLVASLSIPSKSKYLLVIAEGPQQLNGIPGVETVKENENFRLLKTPNDPRIDDQWNISRIGAPGAWDIITGSPLVTVAVVDSGVRADHVDLNGVFLDIGYDFIDNDSDPTDPDSLSYYHGTHVSGIISALTDNSEGIAGVCWGGENGIKLLPIRALSAFEGDGYSIASGIVYAVEHGAKVINLSLGGPDDELVKDAIEFAYENDVIVVASSGNDATDTLLFPAAYPQTIAVGATDIHDDKAWYSNYGSNLDLLAPGGDVIGGILSTYATDSYAYLAGTSMAAPQVSAAAALLISAGFTGTEELREALTASASDLGTPGYDIYYGAGLLQIDAALKYAEHNIDSEPFIIEAVDPYSNKPLASCIADSNGEYSLEVPPVPFYLQVWQDFDHDGEISTGDFFGYYGYNGGDVLAGNPATITGEVFKEIEVDFPFAPVLTKDHD